jgi:hypothetical protein
MFTRKKKFSDLTPSAEAAVVLARQEAQKLHHSYIGTEHILLGLLTAKSGVVANVLSTFSVASEAIRAEIDKLIQRGPESALAGDLPLTPRAKRAIDIAGDEAHNLCQNLIGPEHLLLGLILEGTGVAARVLQNLGLRLSELGREAFKTRIMQMKIVESAVRPVRAPATRKRKTREELLAHFTSIYEEEHARQRDSAAAMKQAQHRFGESAELASELNDAVTFNDRVGYYIERWLGWRASESRTRFLIRVSLVTFAIFLVISCFAIVVDTIHGARITDWAILRPFVFTALSVPVGQFVLGLLYFKLRKTVLGAFGHKKSAPQSVLLVMLIALITFSGGLTFAAVVIWDYERVVQLLIPSALVGMAVGISCWLLVRFRGPAEIRDTIWALLDLKEVSAE